MIIIDACLSWTRRIVSTPHEYDISCIATIQCIRYAKPNPPNQTTDSLTSSPYFVKILMTFAEMCRKKIEAMNDNERTRTMKGSTLRPGESSVYSFSMVFDEPPAPAAREELGLDTVEVGARRRIAAPGGRATAEAERPLGTDLGASESDIMQGM